MNFCDCHDKHIKKQVLLNITLCIDFNLKQNVNEIIVPERDADKVI